MSTVTDEQINRYLAEKMSMPWRKPTHGTCCTCRVCGHGHDECQCMYTEEYWEIVKVEEKIASDGLAENYAWQLAKAVLNYDDVSLAIRITRGFYEDQLFKIATATPAQRALAAYQVWQKHPSAEDNN